MLKVVNLASMVVAIPRARSAAPSPSTSRIGATSGGENPTYSGTATIYGDIYGGSALGEVSATGLLTQVNVYKGTVNGDIYGGGLGQKAVAAVGTQEDPGYVPAVEGIAALVSGNVEVNIRGGIFNAADGTAGGSMIFGANNANGTPKGNVSVNIYATDHGADIAHNLYPSPAPTTASDLATNAATQTYAIAAVFGGGNLASYTPDVTGKSATVHVYNCDNTIKDVYGGGNAADVGTLSVSTNTNVIIDGGRIHRVFGGGNGEVTEANTYGTATTTVNAGLIDQVFGCGNMQGSITSTSLNLLKASGVGACTDEVWVRRATSCLPSSFSTKKVSCMSRAGWSWGKLSAEKRCQSSSISTDSATVKPMREKMSIISFITTESTWRLPISEKSVGIVKSLVLSCAWCSSTKALNSSIFWVAAVFSMLRALPSSFFSSLGTALNCSKSSLITPFLPKYFTRNISTRAALS